jgi:hypothetical protein
MNTLAFVLAFLSMITVPVTLGGLLAWATIVSRRICVGEAESTFEKRVNDGFIAIVAGLVLAALCLYSHDWAVSGAKTYVWYMHTH